MPVNDTTTNRSYQKPNIANTLADDVGRLRSALDAIDTDMASKAPSAGPTFTGVTTVAAGSAAAPSLTFTGATSDTGLYSPGADQVAISTGGTGRLFVDASGNINISTAHALLWALNPTTNYIRLYNTGSNGVDISSFTTLSFLTAGSERARIDSSGRLLVGTSSSADVGGASAVAQFTSTASAPHTLSLVRNNTAILALANSGSVSSGSGLGAILFCGNDGTDLNTLGALIIAEVDGTPGANDMPGRLVFSTTADAASSPTEAMRINNQRELLIGTTTRTANGGVLQISNGITFPGTQSACSDANTLDDYEEGTFTPTIIGSSTAGTATYTTQTGIYTKVGRQVTVIVYLNWSGGTGTGNLLVSGLPFTALGSAGYYYSASFGLVDVIGLTASNVITGYVSQNTTTVTIVQTPVGGGSYSSVAYDAAGHFLLSCTYFV